MTFKPNDGVIKGINLVIKTLNDDINSALVYIRDVVTQLPEKINVDPKITSYETISGMNESRYELDIRKLELVTSTLEDIKRKKEIVDQLQRTKLSLFEDVDFNGATEYYKNILKSLE